MKELEKNQKVKISSYIYQEVFCKKKNEFWKNSQNNRMKSIIVDNFCRQFCRATSSNLTK